MSLSSLVSRVIPAAVGFVTGGPVGAVTAAAATEQAKKQERQIKQQISLENQRRKEIMEYFGNTGSSIPTIQANLAATTPRVSTASSGGGFFDTVRGGLREVGGFIGDVFQSGIPQLFGVSRPPSVGQQPALTTVTNIGAQESQGSGSIQAGAGSLLAPLVSGARSFLKTPQGQLALGGGAGIVTSLLGGDGKTMRITRKMKSQARMVVNMTNGNLSAAADILGIDQNTLVMILLKRFRNDGPVVTKAALRKTKQTVRRLKSMCDMYDSLRPTATRRRSPMKRATTTTLIKN
tara:strand:+ start:422 stop:1297 length:876 start_codon:yes stop_codon:yes gene_type:complete